MSQIKAAPALNQILFEMMVAVAQKLHQQLAPGERYPGWQTVVTAIHQHLCEKQVWGMFPLKTQWKIEQLLRGILLPENIDFCRMLVEDGVLSIMSALASADEVVAQASQ